MITRLEEVHTLGKRLKTLAFPVLVVDEIGHLRSARIGAMLFFRLMPRRYEHGATVLT